MQHMAARQLHHVPALIPIFKTNHTTRVLPRCFIRAPVPSALLRTPVMHMTARTSFFVLVCTCCLIAALSSFIACACVIDIGLFKGVFG